jgi:hypothetical protein
MGKASRLKRERSELRADTRRTLIDRVSSRLGAARGIPESQPDQPPISGLLRQLIAPYHGEEASLDAYRKLVLFGMLAWNRAVLQQAEGQAMFHDLGEALEGEPADKRSVLEVFDEMTERKRQLFPDDRRVILEVETLREPDGSFRIAVASGVMDPEEGDN